MRLRTTPKLLGPEGLVDPGFRRFGHFVEREWLRDETPT